MKKIFLTLLFNILFSVSGFAQTIASANYDNNMSGGIKDINKCWECKLVEGVYTYTFNFVFKMYNILAPIVTTFVLVFLAFWFLWYIWENVIKAQINFKGGNVFDFLKEIALKCVRASEEAETQKKCNLYYNTSFYFLPHEKDSRQKL